MQTMSNPRMTLYTYFRSSCSTRVRIALQLKGLNDLVKYCYVDASRDEHLQAPYNKISPSCSLPCLIVEESADEYPGMSPLVISQSFSILEFLEERFPTVTPHLLPPLPSSSANDGERLAAISARSEIRTLVNTVVADWQPLANLSPVRKVVELNANSADNTNVVMDSWLEWSETRGMLAYEKYSKTMAGQYSVGDNISLADVVLVPAVENWLRLGLKNQDELFKSEFPTIYRIFERCKQLEAFQKAHWSSQKDYLESGSEEPSFQIGGNVVTK
ncbi:hypothetical protein F5884DRAFT_734116 [Xylogone sp. PMI_703]|nr:hypothetical protein F5884DRAFT_734116 [Xylogone sp. PMI_703]